MADRDKGKEKALEPLEGTNIFHFKRKKIENTSDGQDAEAAGNKESEGTEATIDIEALDGTETEDTSEEEKTVLSPKESSTNNPKDLKMKRVREEEEDDQEDKEKKLKAADSLSDTGTSKFPTTPPIDKFMDSDKDDQSKRSPPGGL